VEEEKETGAGSRGAAHVALGTDTRAGGSAWAAQKINQNQTKVIV
jgi:hypothetical protein